MSDLTTKDALLEKCVEQLTKIDELLQSMEWLNKFGKGAGFHNSLFRGKNLGDTVTDDQYDAIDDGSFDDLFIGDYWEINNVKWRIGEFNYWLKSGNTQTTQNHVLIVPDDRIATAAMNSSGTTAGAYAGSDFYTGDNLNTGRADAIAVVEAAFGASHILSHKEYFANAVTSGRQSAGGWYDATVELMNEHMVYGSKMFEATSDGTNVPVINTIDKSQLRLFALDGSFINSANQLCWLRDVVSASYYALISNANNSAYGAAQGVYSIRPCFAIYKGV